MLFAVDPVGEEDGREVDVGEVSAMEGAESVAREAFDPFSACGGVEDGIGGTAHDGLFGTRTCQLEIVHVVVPSAWCCHR